MEGAFREVRAEGILMYKTVQDPRILAPKVGQQARDAGPPFVWRVTMAAWMEAPLALHRFGGLA